MPELMAEVVRNIISGSGKAEPELAISKGRDTYLAISIFQMYVEQVFRSRRDRVWYMSVCTLVHAALPSCSGMMACARSVIHPRVYVR